MWPFTGKRIFGSRWWAIAFVIYVCWQAMQFTGPTEADNASVTAEDVQAVTDALNTF